MKKIIFIIPLLLFNHYVQAASVSWSNINKTVNENDVFSLDITGSNFINNVDGGGVNVSFDPNVVNVVSVTINETVWNFGPTGVKTGTIDNTAGSINGIMVNTFSTVTGNFTVATVNFQTVGSGGASTNLALSKLTINPWASGGVEISPDYINASINITPPPIIDLDGDGIDDAIDNCPAIANSAQTNTDNDGEGNACDLDDDNDGLSDTEEATLGTNPLLADSDSDGTNDNTDNCPIISNSAQTDTDNDGIGNACDADDDNDGLTDAEEAILGTNPLLSDTDGDGLADNIDVFPTNPDETNDIDTDGIGNNIDNCPVTANSSQTDVDNDGIGDICDTDNDNDGLSDAQEQLLGTNRLLADTDFDGINDGNDAFPLDSSEIADSDADGFGDNSDNCPAITNNTQTDTDNDGSGNVCDADDDNDGLSDAQEQLLGTNQLLADTDSDGVNDNIDAFPLDVSESTDSDNDGAGDNADAFPNNLAASVDEDNDGKPEVWNPGCDASCQENSGLVLDNTETTNSGGGGGSLHPMLPLLIALFIMYRGNIVVSWKHPKSLNIAIHPILVFRKDVS